MGGCGLTPICVSCSGLDRPWSTYLNSVCNVPDKEFFGDDMPP